jgi:hypothetical protein
MRVAAGLVLTSLCLSVAPAQKPCCPEASPNPFSSGGWEPSPGVMRLQQDDRPSFYAGPGLHRYSPPLYRSYQNDFTWKHMGEDLYYQYSPTLGVVAAYYSKSGRFYWLRGRNWEQDTSAPWAMAHVKEDD